MVMAVREFDLKRVIDLVVSMAGLLLLSPLLLLIALMIRFTSQGPVIFRHTRIGRYGRAFELLKFRTMSILINAENGRFDLGNSQRVTRFGQILRKTKLDELPQLWNVWKGEMSLVGPRPEVEPWVREFRDRWDKVLVIRPGMTDPASIMFHDEEYRLSKSSDPEKTYREVILPRKLDLYEKYVNEQTLCGDVQILIQTILVILKPRRKNYE